MLFIPWEISLSFLFRETKICRDTLRSLKYAKCLKRKTRKDVHPVFEKLEFYLNLKNDFALTFLQDKHRVYLFLRRIKQIYIPEMLTNRDTWRIFSRAGVTSLTEEYSIFFLFPFCCSKLYETESLWLFFLFLVS